MYKTIWYINDNTDITELTYYHFRKDPIFPPWYMEDGYTYEIKISKIIKQHFSFKVFFKCLTHFYIIK